MASSDFATEKENFRLFYDKNYLNLKNSLDLLINLIKTLLNADTSIHVQHVLGRIKDKDGCIAKFSRKYQANLESNNIKYEIKDQITDLLGLRIVCLYEDEIDKIKKIIERDFEILEITDKIQTLEEHDDTFGYKALHLDVMLAANRKNLPEYQICCNNKYEIQIRTIVQDAWSVLDHNIKYKKSIPVKLKRRINALSALFDIADREFLSVREETVAQEVRAERGGGGGEPNGSTLDAFQYLSFMKQYFPGDSFSPKAIDGFVQDLIFRKKDITRSYLDQVISERKSTVEKYCKHLHAKSGDTMNPFTMLRHMLYLNDKEMFYNMLFNIQRSNFEEWLACQKGCEKPS